MEEIKTNPFSLVIDGSSDTGLEKLNPLTVMIFDMSRSQILTHLLDMCTTSGRECGTAVAIFSKIDFVLNKYDIPWTQVYLLFYESVLCTFTHVNLFLQREDPSIYLVDDAIRALLTKLLSKFVTLQAIIEQDDITKVDFTNPVNHLSNHVIIIGMVTKQCLQKLLNEDDICANDERKFYAGVRAFYIDATSQALHKLPFNDCVLNNARFLNFERKEDCTFDAVHFFCAKYPDLLKLTHAQMDRLQEEFTDYQLLERSEIPDTIWKEVLIYEKGTEVSKLHNGCNMGLPVRHKECGQFAQVRTIVKCGQIGFGNPP